MFIRSIDMRYIMRNKVSTIITFMGILFLLGTVQAQSENSLVYFSSELEVGYEYTWDSITYTAPTFLSDEIVEKHNYTIEILKEIDIDIHAISEAGEIIAPRWGITNGTYIYFLFSIDGTPQTLDWLENPESLENTTIVYVSINLISKYISPNRVEGSNGEITNQFDILADNYSVNSDEEYVIDGNVVTYKLDTGGDVVSKYIEKQYEYSTGLLLYSNESTFGENGLISQNIMTLANNIETAIITQTLDYQTPTDATEIAFLPIPPTWLFIAGITSVCSINKRKKSFN